MRRAAFVARDLSKRSMMAGSVRLAHTVRDAEMPAHSYSFILKSRWYFDVLSGCTCVMEQAATGAKTFTHYAKGAVALAGAGVGLALLTGTPETAHAAAPKINWDAVRKVIG